MPRLRFTRDERGYEHTFLVHTVRRRGKDRTRVLYWFRSPPAVRVGRPALDAEAIRAIEDANPDIAFDWVTILAARPPEPEPVDGWRARRGRAARDRDLRESPARELVGPLPSSQSPPVASSTVGQSTRVGGPQSSRPAVGATEPDEDLEAVVIEPSAVQRALGSEGLLRVRARYAEVLARISSQVADAAVADELRVLAERLNPDAWVTTDEVREGLEGFERVLESVRRRLGPPVRRRGAAQPEREAPPRPVTVDGRPGSSSDDAADAHRLPD